MRVHDQRQIPTPSYSTPLALSASNTPMNDDNEERVLMRQVVNHDSQAFETLYARHAPDLRAYLRRSLPPHAHVEEVLNDVMMVLWRGAARVPPSCPLAAWLFGIAKHHSLRAWRNAGRAHLPTQAGMEEITMTTPESDLLCQEHLMSVRRFLDRLPPDQRQLIELTVGKGLSYEEVSSQTHINVNTIRTRIARARRKLQDYILAQG